MTLQDFLAVLRRQWLVIVVATVVGAGLAAAASLSAQPVYRASAQTFVSTSGAETTGTASQGSQFILQRVASYVSVATSAVVLDTVADERGLGESLRALKSRVSASSPSGTVLVDISATASTPQDAADLANQVAAEFVVTVQDIERPAADQPSTVMVTVIEQASPPGGPISPRRSVDLVLGVLLGGFVGVGLGLVRQQLDTRVSGVEDLRALTGRTPLGLVVSDHRAASDLAGAQDGGPWSEAFRAVRDNLQLVDVDAPPRVVVVTSATPGEGKSTTACHLALAMAAGGVRVLLVDADLRRPAVAGYLGLEGGVGLVDVLAGRADLADVVQPSVLEGMSVLTAGRIPPDPSTLLASRQMRELLERVRGEFDAVVLDAPPALPVSDATILAGLADGALLVVRDRRARRVQVTAAAERVATGRGQMLGTVLTFVARRHLAGVYGYGHGYGPTPGGRRRALPVSRAR